MGLFKLAAFSFFLILTFACFAFLLTPTPAFDSEGQAKRRLNELHNELLANDPERARALERLRKDSDHSALALAIAMDDAQSRGRLHAEVDAAMKNESVALAVQEALGSDLNVTNSDRVAVYMSYFGHLAEQDRNLALRHARQLKAYVDDRLTKLAVERDPLVLAGLLALDGPSGGPFLQARPSLRSEYLEQSDWLGLWAAEVVDGLALSRQEGSPSDASENAFEPEALLAAAIDTGCRHSDLLSRSWKASETAGDHADAIPPTQQFALFSNFGGIIESVVNGKLGLLDETMEVVFASQGWLLEMDDERSSVVSMMLEARDRHPVVWRRAKADPLALKLYHDAGPKVATLFSELPDMNVASFLYSFAGEGPHGVVDPILLKRGVEAVVKYGELAIAVLDKYRDDDLFREHLKKETLGVRIIPFVAKFESQGLQDLVANQKWLDKYFDKDGNPIGADWWETLPGGGLAKVAKNWSNGVPNDWSELGWGALDVVDAALAVASLGTSSVATQSVKVTGKASVKAMGKQATRAAGKSLGRKVVASSSRKQTQSILRAVIGKKIPSTLVRIGNAFVRVIVIPAKAAREFVQVLKRGGTATAQAWQRLPVGMRKMVLRGTFALSVTTKLYIRNETAIREGIDAIGRMLEDFAESADRLRKAIDAIRQGLPGGEWWTTGRIVALSLLLVLVPVTWLLRPRSRRIKYV